MNEIIPYAKQNIVESDIEAVVEVLRSDYITQGPKIEEFERTIADYCGAHYAVAVNSATSALHIACLAAGLSEGDLLWTSPNTFVASANCGLYCRAKIDFVDIDEKTYNMSVDDIKLKLDAGSPPPKVVIPVHFAGHSCDMHAIYNLSQKYNFKVIEDASHALGGLYKGDKIGGCKYSDMAVFSFHPAKIITSGEGGMIVTNGKDLYERLISLRNHGITRDISKMDGKPHGPWYYQQLELGYNYRITDIQAALGISQMKRVDNFVEKRHIIAERYNHALRDLPLCLPHQEENVYSSYHLYVVRIKTDKIKKTHLEVFEELRNNNINVNIHYIPVHTHPFYKRLGFRDGQFPKAEKYYSEAISLPIYYDLSEDQQDKVIKTLTGILA